MKPGKGKLRENIFPGHEEPPETLGIPGFSVVAGVGFELTHMLLNSVIYYLTVPYIVEKLSLFTVLYLVVPLADIRIREKIRENF